MKKLSLLFYTLVAVIIHSSIVAQTISTNYSLGDVKDVISQFSAKKIGQSFTLETSSKQTIAIKTTAIESNNGQLKIFGAIEGASSSIFYLNINSDGVNGRVLNNDKNFAYQILTNASNEVIIKEVDISEFVCVSPTQLTQSEIIKNSNNSAKPQSLAALPILNSNPGAPIVIYLDFDGEYINDNYWNNQIGGPRQANPPNFSNAFITEVWANISEDYRPFNITITTERAVFDAASTGRKVHCIYTTSFTISGSGGYSEFSIISNSTITNKCFVFSHYLEQTVGDQSTTGAHESGHGFDLRHDGSSNPSTNYWEGHGVYCSIMGNNYQTGPRSVFQWSKGEYQYATTQGGGPNTQDDIASIATRPGSSFRTDDHGGTMGTATAIKPEANGSILATKNNGIIEQRTDKDYFSFTHGGGAVVLNLQSGTNTSPKEGDLDIQVRVLNSAGTQVAISNPTGLNASVNTTLAAGDYYIEIDGVGAGDPVTNGYSDYGSLGYYQISGSYKIATVAAPVADYKFTIPSMCVGTVNFNDLSTNTPTSWAWNFGDGGTSTLQNPSHTYATAGTYSVKLTATNTTGSGNITKAVSVLMTTALPFSENFEGTFPPTAWVINNPDSGIQWEQRKDAGYQSSSCMVINNADNATIGAIDEIMTGKFDFTTATTAKMTFYVAYTKYDANSPDVLRVYVSKDCGNNWTEKYMKTHTDLETVSVADGLPSNQWIPTKDSDWRMETINLDTYAGQNNVVFKFHNTSGYGTRIWIDNINIIGLNTTGVGQLANNPDVNIYPNPTTSGILNVKLSENEKNYNLILYDVLGKTLKQQTLQVGNNQINISDYNNGIYFIRLSNDNTTNVYRIIKN